MGVFDQAARSATEIEPHAIISRLMSIAQMSLRFASWGDPRITVQPQERDQTADRLVVLVDPAMPNRPWLGVLEFQSAHDPDKLDDTFAEVAQVRRSKRHGDDRLGKYNVLAALIYLAGRCPDPVLDMTMTSGLGSRHAPIVWNLCDASATQALEDYQAGRITWGILFLVPLMNGAADPLLIRRWRDLLSGLPTNRDRANLIRIALIFAGLTGVAQEWLSVLENDMTTESTVMNMWIDQERVQTTKDLIVDLLTRRFPGQVTDDIKHTIGQQPSESMLRDWHFQAATAGSINDFITVLRR